MEPIYDEFKESFEIVGRDLTAAGLERFMEHMPYVVVEDNGPGGITTRTPLLLNIEFHAKDQEPVNMSAPLTLDEATKLRNILSRAIVWAEGALAG